MGIKEGKREKRRRNASSKSAVNFCTNNSQEQEW